jgi:hypothetical protein
VQQYRELLEYTEGPKGKLLVKTPLEWAFRRDPFDTGLVRGWAQKPLDLSYWDQLANAGSLESRMRHSGQWEMLRTDLYMQAQGVISPDYQNFNGHAWYRTEVALEPNQTDGPVHIRFPGLFNECWLYVNGFLVAYRPQAAMWWHNDYRFEWDVDLTGKVRAGKNTLALRLHNPHHCGGLFRRPFLYRPTEEQRER